MCKTEYLATYRNTVKTELAKLEADDDAVMLCVRYTRCTCSRSLIIITNQSDQPPALVPLDAHALTILQCAALSICGPVSHRSPLEIHATRGLDAIGATPYTITQHGLLWRPWATMAVPRRLLLADGCSAGSTCPHDISEQKMG